MGDVTEMFPLSASASGSPTICHILFSPVSSSISPTVQVGKTWWRASRGHVLEKHLPGPNRAKETWRNVSKLTVAAAAENAMQGR
jgi:hypothetical protein